MLNKSNRHPDTVKVIWFFIVMLGLLTFQVKAKANIMEDAASDKTTVKFKAGTEISSINYKEPGVMEEEGIMFGILGDVTIRWPNRVVFGVDGKFSWGEVDYDSDSTGSVDDIDDWMGEIRVTGGYDLYAFDATRITPYGGFGYRYLLDELGGQRSSTSALGYDRAANYYYLPIGVKTVTDMSNGWLVGFNVEFDVFLSGTQKSYLGDAISGLDTLENDQDDGYGVRGSVKVVKQLGNSRNSGDTYRIKG